MTRLLALLLPVVILAAGTGATNRAVSGGNIASLGKHWTASLEAEIAKKYDEALTEARAYEQEGGDAFLAAEHLGWLHYLSADYAKSEQSYNKAAQLKPSAINPLLGLLSVAQGLKDPKKTERASDAILRVEPTNYRAQMALAGLHFAEKDYRKSASEYRRVLTHYPDDVDAMSGAAWAAFYLADKAEAIDGFRRILSISPTYPLAQRGYDLASGKGEK